MSGKSLLIAGLAAASLLVGCTHEATAPQIVDVSCRAFGPIYLEPGDSEKVSSELATQILVHNTVGARLCNWMPAQ